MGDWCCNPEGLGGLAADISASLNGTFVHSVETGEGWLLDIASGFFGSVDAQVSRVCAQLRALPELAGGYVALGISQGGQFLRAVVERCQHQGPRAHTLVTLGGQHQGVMAAPGCASTALNGTASVWCSTMQAMLSRGAYVGFVQARVVQAQYFKDPYDLPAYLEAMPFLADINCEYPGYKNPLYRDNLASLQRLVLVQFDDDDMVVPKESAHFGFFNGTRLIPMRESDMYLEDWIGLKELDTAGRIVFLNTPGRHLQFDPEWFTEQIVEPFLRVSVAGARVGVAEQGSEVAAA
ncbi:palmitoyl protein thioesterase [Helicosporidium sp. ATCC 50920]|nr:palmitoyl protein thioesterase [Helicosporidium sp. ATCC 50920]|eukprot:KDD74445.1 palmitoyl protein thioesterase [Helicosporidium sp. ATCC 50920]